MRNRYRIIISLVVALSLAWALPAADGGVGDGGVIVRSPYYGTSATVPDTESISRSYLAQLGIGTDDTALLSDTGKVLAAISNSRYPVTPGDTINLLYTDGKTPVDLTLQVDGSYRVVVPSFGSVDGRGVTFTEFARQIENLVITYLPFSLPRVTLTGTGAFSVVVRGEVSATREVPAWGLSRLSSVVAPATPYASTRDVRVTSSDGQTTSYDLYAAMREGDLSQNPYLKAGDIVTIPRAQRIVTLAGEVVRPGVYQPLPGETLSAVISRYGNGLLPSGDADGVLVRRYGTGSAATVDVIRIDSPQSASFTLKNLDTVFVSPLVPVSRAVTVEGAVGAADAQVLTSSVGSSGRIYYQFFPGETVLEMLQSIAHRFSAVSDLAGAYLMRGDRLIPVDVQAMLLGNPTEASSLRLAEGDRFVIPFNQLFVTVAGGVLKPGTFPYIPDKEPSYYINLAGGFDPAKNRNGNYSVIDKQGTKLAKDATVPPEAVVTASVNTFQAVNGMSLTTTVAIVGLVATIVSILVDVADLIN